MWPCGNTAWLPRCNVAWFCGLLAVLCWGPGREAAGQAPLAAPVVDWSHVRHAYGVAERWIDAGQVPEAADLSIPVSRLVGVRVTLRWTGRTVGRGDHYDEPDIGRQDLIVAVGHACRAALRQFRQMVRAAAGGRSRPDREAGGPIGPLQLDIQVGYRLQPVVLDRQATTGDLLERFAPGHHGLTARRRQKARIDQEAWIWPASALAMNLRPQGQVRRLMVELGYRSAAGEKLGRLDDLAISLFDVIHMVRPALDLPVERLVRGNKLIVLRALTGPDVRGAAQRMADHLIQRQRDDGSFSGTFLPSSQEFDRPTADAGQATLAAYSLGRRLRLIRLAGTGGDPQQEGRLQTCLQKAVFHLLPRMTDRDQPPQVAAAALMLMTLVEAPHMAVHKAARDHLAGHLMRLASDERTYAAARRGRHGQELAAMLAALTGYFRQTRNRELLPILERGRRWLWQDHDTGQVIAMLPYASMAELDLVQLAGPMPGADRLADLKRLILARQIVEPPPAGPADVLGGFDLAGAGRPLPAPDWQSASMTAFLAASVRTSDPVSEPDVLIACALATRFLAQLMFDEPGCFYTLHRQMMIGAARRTLWDNRLELAPTAMALLALTELQETLWHMANNPLQPAEASP